MHCSFKLIISLSIISVISFDVIIEYVLFLLVLKSSFL